MPDLGPCDNPNCPFCHPMRPIIVLIADQEPQMWKMSPKGNVIPVWVDESNETKK